METTACKFQSRSYKLQKGLLNYTTAKLRHHNIFLIPFTFGRETAGAAVFPPKHFPERKVSSEIVPIT